MEEDIIFLFSKNILKRLSAPKQAMEYIITEIIKMKIKLILIIFIDLSLSLDP